MKLSVIIPIYKVENYLERCVKSVLNQDYRDLEVILVDDGSPDRCPQICDELAQTDDRIVVVHKPNGGVSSARNAGIEKAQGEYLIFLDSDDQWVEGRLKPLMEQIVFSDVDMLMFRSMSLYPDGTTLQRNDGVLFQEPFYIFLKVYLYDLLIKIGNFHEQVGTQIVRTSFIKHNKLFFKQELTVGEDTERMFRVMRSINNIAVSNIVLQVYTEQRPESITNTNSTKSLYDLIEIIQYSIDYHSAFPNTDVCKYEMSQCAYLWSIALGYYSLLPAHKARKFKAVLRNQKKDLNLKTHPKSNLVGKVYSILGFTLTSKILAWYINLHRKNLVNAKKIVNE